jgi:trigger factor
MVKIQKKKLPKALMQLTLEVEDEAVQVAIAEATAELVKKSKIPGFRPGKAPKHIIEKNFGKAAIFQQALDKLLPKVYSESVKAESIEPIGQPEIDIKSTEPLVIEVKVPTKPIIKLGDYQKYTVSEPDMPAIEPLVKDSIETLRKQYSILEPVDRPIKWGDTVRIDFTLKIEGETESQSEEDAEFSVFKENNTSLPGFLDKLIDKERNKSYNFTIKIPKDFQLPELANKKAEYAVKIKEIKNQILPDVNDEFVKSLESGINNVKDLENKLHEDVKKKLESDQKTAFREEIINLFVAKSEMEFPDVLIEREIERIIDQQSNHASHTPQGFNKWLESIGKTESEVKETFYPVAETSVKRSLVLSEIINIENISASQESMELETNKVKLDPSFTMNPDKKKMEELINSDDFKSSLENQIITNLAWDRLEAIATGNKVKQDKVSINKKAISSKNSQKKSIQSKEKKQTKKK